MKNIKNVLETANLSASLGMDSSTEKGSFRQIESAAKREGFIATNEGGNILVGEFPVSFNGQIWELGWI